MINLAHLLYKNGINNLCISPGLRNTAISLSFIKHGKFNCHSIIDERSAGYFALGIAIKTKKPSVLICTSGTATANYLPAIIEASQSKIPLLIITADRPTNLLNTGENQTINQNNIYGNFVRASVDFSQNDKNLEHINNSLKFFNDKYDELIPGPIHFNIHLNNFEKFDDKIIHKNIPDKLKHNPQKRKKFNWEGFPYEDIFNIYNYNNPLIIIGRLNEKLDIKLIMKLSKHLKAPVIADPLSQIRFDNNDVLSFYDHYIELDNINPDLIIRIGQKPVSKKLCKKIAKWNKSDRLKISSLLIDKNGRFNDDTPTIIKSEYKEFINFIVSNTNKNDDSNFYDYLNQLDKKVSAIINDETEWSELIIAKASLLSIKNEENFVIGNSMPIRYIDILGNLITYPINTYSNRGASGIDGIIATALGISLVSSKKTTLLIGDLSFIYDQQSLLIAKELKINLTIIVINNNGGGIFSLLPVSKTFDKKTFNKYWTTAHNLDLKKIAHLYDCHYKKVTTMKQLNTVLLKDERPSGIEIIDTHIDIETNKKYLSDLKKRIKKGIV